MYLAYVICMLYNNQLLLDMSPIWVGFFSTLDIQPS